MTEEAETETPAAEAEEIADVVVEEEKEEANEEIEEVTEGMHCMHCSGAVKKALEAQGLTAEVSLEEKQALVEGDAPDAAIIEAVTKKGFTVVSVEKA